MLELAAVLVASLLAGAVSWLLRGRRPPSSPTPAVGVVVAAAAGAWFAAEVYRVRDGWGAAAGFLLAFFVAAGGYLLGTGAATRTEAE